MVWVAVLAFAFAGRAEEESVPLLTGLSSSTISGYIDVSASWSIVPGEAALPIQPNFYSEFSSEVSVVPEPSVIAFIFCAGIPLVAWFIWMRRVLPSMRTPAT
jgi:hypothetical protein